MNKINYTLLSLLLMISSFGFSQSERQFITYTTAGKEVLSTDDIWLSHEHVLVDFIGADYIQPDTWNQDVILKEMIPYFKGLQTHKVAYYVDATPNYIGRNVLLLDKIAKQTGIKIITNTGFYGARNDKFIPKFAFNMTVEELSGIWINEFEKGIDGTAIKPGFIKIGVDNNSQLDSIDIKLVKAAARTHLKTGLTIASHTGQAKGFWPQLEIIKQLGVSPSSFIWVHAQQEEDLSNYVKAAKAGCWISLDGFGWEIDGHIERLLFAKKKRILGNILISHDAGWYDPQKKTQDIKPYINIFEVAIPKLKERGFTEDEIDLLLKINPVKAFSLKTI